MSNNNLLAARLQDVVAMALIGDAVLAFAMPEKSIRLWRTGPAWWEKLVTPLRNRPDLVRLLSVAEAGVGLWLGSRIRADVNPTGTTSADTGRIS